MPSDLQNILNNYRIESTVYAGTPDERTVLVPEINPRHPNVTVLNYVPYAKEYDVEGNLTGEYRDVFVLGIEDLGIKDSVEFRPDQKDDWKDWIVSIRRVPTFNEVWVTFQVSYSNFKVYDNTKGELIYDSEVGPPLKTVTTPTTEVVGFYGF